MDARASQTHCHTIGSTSYANKRADFVEILGREPTSLEFFKDAHEKKDGGFVADTATKSFLNEAKSKVQERLLNSSPSKTQVEIENEVFDDLMYEDETPKRPVRFGFGVDRNAIFGVNGVLKKRGYSLPTNNDMEIKRLKADLSAQKAMVGLMSNSMLELVAAVRNGQVSHGNLDAIESVCRMAGGQVTDASSGNGVVNGRQRTDPFSLDSQMN